MMAGRNTEPLAWQGRREWGTQYSWWRRDWEIPVQDEGWNGGKEENEDAQRSPVMGEREI